MKAMEYTLSGWPEHTRDIDPLARELYSERGQLSVSRGLLLHGHRIVVLHSMRSQILPRIHDGHQGQTKCRKIANDTVWRPGIASEMVENCDHCQSSRPSHQREPLQPTPLPSRPWVRIGADLCEWKGHQYLIVVDYYSRWIEIFQMTSTTSQLVVSQFKGIFARFGEPTQLVTDNGPQLQSHKFQRV